MIEAIIAYSIRNKIQVLALSAVIIIFGIYQATQLSIDALPDVTHVQVSVVTKAPGLSPREVEQIITYPIELSLNGMPQIKELRSISRTGVSSVTAIFKDKVDIYFARQLVLERLREAETMIPPGYGYPELSPIATALGDIYELNLISDRHSAEELRTYLDWELGPQLKAIPGVIDINVFGGELKQYQIVIEPTKLALHKLQFNEILQALEATNLNVGGGYIKKGPEQWVIRGEGQIKNLDDLKNVTIRTSPTGTPLLLKQISDVKIGHALRFGATTRAGFGEVVGITVIMLKGQNSRTVVNSVKKVVDRLEKRLPPGMKIQPYYDRSEFIGRTLKTVLVNLLEGASLVIVILLFSLGSLKGAIFTAMAIPFSMFFAVIFMKIFGVIGNLMSLGAIDFGLLVDGPVVMLEAVLVSAVLNSKSNSMEESVSAGCARVGRASAFSVAIILLVYLPLLTLEEVEGKMFQPMAITMALALTGSLLFSLTTFPAALATFYRQSEAHISPFWLKFQSEYRAILSRIQAKPKPILIFSFIFLIFSAIMGQFLGTEFIPRIDEGEITIDIKRLPSTSIEHSKDLNVEIEKVLFSFPEVVSVVSRTGRGESAAEPTGTEEGEIMVKLRNKKEWVNGGDIDQLMNSMKNKILNQVPSTYISMSQPIEDRVNDILAGSKADVVAKIYGDDLDQLKMISEQVASRVKNIEGTGDLRVQRILGLPMLDIRINREKIARYGVKADEILTAVKSLRVGADAGKVFEGLRRFDIVLLLGVDATSLEAVENVPVMTLNGHTVPLGMVTDIRRIEGPAVIYRENLKRRVFVEINIRGRDLGSYVKEAQSSVKELIQKLPEGYDLKWGGQYQNFLHAKDRLLVVVPIIELIIFLMLVLAFKNVRLALGISILMPLSISGGILALQLRTLPFSIPAAIGFIALSGITVLTGIVYSNSLRALLAQGKPLHEAVIDAAVESARPVLTTELIAAIGFLPMALSTGAGAEVQRPLATVVIGGLITGTALAQLLLPMLMEHVLKFGTGKNNSS